MSSFFTTPASQRKRKRQDSGPSTSTKRQITASSTSRTPNEKSRRNRSESISGSDLDDEDDRDDVRSVSESSDDENENETAAEKRLRLAEQYLENIRAEVDEAGFDAADVDQDIITRRLKEDVAESKGKVYRHIASALDVENAIQTFFRADQRDITALACCAPYAYTVAKDRSIVKWEIPVSTSSKPSHSGDNGDGEDIDNDAAPETPHSGPNYTPPLRPKKLAFSRGTRSKQKSYIGHTADILCAAASTTGRFLATGGLDRRIVIWDVSTTSSLKPVKVFPQHRDAVTGLVFRRGTNQLYSCSKDRTVKVWSLDELAYVETLFGHQDAVVNIAAGYREQCVSVGARDRTARLWKVGEETQLVFRGGGIAGKQKNKDRGPDKAKAMSHLDEIPPEGLHAEGSIDRVALVDDETFVTGSDSGAISLWSIHKKKAVAVVPLAHGLDPPIKLEDAFAEEDLEGRKVPAPPGARWITALATIPYSDIVVSGSWDGAVRMWRVREDRRGLDAIGVIGSALTARDADQKSNGTQVQRKAVKGVINDICVFEKGERAKDGVKVVIGLSNSPRLGRWRSFEGKSTAVVFDISQRRLEIMANGINGHAEKEEKAD
ncbi:small nucleolar ribonucleoprotein-like protein complex subunit [Rhizodiscina lignyota]|uniref:Small nucleolar ribonucleoprotein-like protein complex subunit n=1 Tax=Rhizodiscina lignyota TaxID=1504668 RepID=A0A9P4M653_9PEZI|nr:small nucleolar ribonucleoprotein-like protein complex subunit [Rhizodiscina lignyota]